MANIVITPPGRFAFPKITELWEAREVLYRFGARDVTLRYRQTFLGVAWVVLQPLITALIFTLVFGKVAHLSSGGLPYLVFSFVGLLAWNLFNNIVTRAQQSLVLTRDLVSKVFFPRMLVPLAVIYASLVDLAVSTAFLVVLLVIYGISPGWWVFLYPLWVLMVVTLASAVGLATSALTVRYRDVNYFVPFFLQFLLFASPIAYSVSNIHSQYRWIYDINPLVWLLQEFQWALVHQPAPPAWEIVMSIVLPIGLFVVSAMIFEQMERGFADVI